MTPRKPTCGFRIVGSPATRRRLVDAAAPLAGYAACDPKAEVEKEAYLSAFSFGEDFRQRADGWGTVDTRGFNGPCGAAWLWWDIDRPDDLGYALSEARSLAGYMLERYR